jgi:hypothetical protein
MNKGIEGSHTCGMSGSGPSVSILEYHSSPVCMSVTSKERGREKQAGWIVRSNVLSSATFVSTNEELERNVERNE